jgi:hypothetical protein
VKRLGWVTIYLIIYLSISTLASGPSPEAIQFLRNRMAIIKGETAAPAVASEFPPPKCGTPVALAAFVLGRQTHSSEILSLLQRPSNLPDTLGTAHFLVHYTTVGVDSVYRAHRDTTGDGIPDYVNNVADIFEHAWSVEVGSLGYDPPLPDSGLGNDNRFDVYVADLGPGYFGFTAPDTLTNYGYRASASIEIENDFAGTSYAAHPLDGLKVTAAHEFFHGIQFAYDATEFDYINAGDPSSYKPWWEEASSTWMETVVYPGIPDYLGYLPYFYKYIWIGLGSFSYNFGDPKLYHPYASAVWPIFLTEKFNDIDIMRQIWTIDGQSPGYNTLAATNQVLSQRGSNLSDAFMEFELWNFHTGRLADQQRFFSNGGQFPEAETALYLSDLRSAPDFSIAGDRHPPEDLAGRYIVMPSFPQAAGGVDVNFDGQNLIGAGWHVTMFGFPGDSLLPNFVDPGTGAGFGVWPAWNFYEAVILAPTISGLTPQYNAFIYSGTVTYNPADTGSGGTPHFQLLQAFPSPFVADGSNHLRIPYFLDKTYEPVEFGLWIYDLSGQKVTEIPRTDLSMYPGKRELRWDGRNSRGELVASGIYICLLQAGDNSARNKIAVVNDSR